MLDRADAAWVGPVCVCSVVGVQDRALCVSVRACVFFGDDKLLRARVLSARIVPAPTNRPAKGDSVSSRQRPAQLHGAYGYW